MSGLAIAATGLAMVSSGCCDRFSRSKIEEGARGDAAASKVAWTLRLGDAVNGTACGAASAPSGDVVIACALHAGVELGNTELPASGGASSESSLGDVVVWKLNAGGKPVWAKRFGGRPEESVSRVAVNAAGSVFVGGLFHRSMEWGPNKWDAAADVLGGFVGTLDSTGKPGWGMWFDASPVKLALAEPVLPFGATVDGVALDASGRLYVLGNYLGTLRMSGRQLIADDPDRVGGSFLARFDPGGALRWYKMGSFPERAKRAKDAPPTPPTFRLRGSDVCTTSQSRVVTIGVSEGEGEFAGAMLKSTGERSLFLSVRAESGENLWTEQFAAKGELWFPRVAAGEDGSLFVVGVTGGEIALGATVVKTGAGSASEGGVASAGALFAAKLDSEGKVAWAKRLGTVAALNPVGLSVDPSGGFVVTATLPSQPAIDTDFGGGALFEKPAPGADGAIVVASYGADGAHRWSRGFTTAERNRAGAVTVTSKGRAVVVGGVNGGQCLLTCETKQLGDVFVAGLGK